MVKIDKKIISQKIVTKGASVSPLPIKELPRPRYLDGTYKIKSHHYPEGFYVTINYRDKGYYEIFINTGNEGMWWLDIMTLHWSALMREKRSNEFWINELLRAKDPKGRHQTYDPHVDRTKKPRWHESIIAEIGYILKIEEPTRLLKASTTFHEAREEIVAEEDDVTEALIPDYIDNIERTCPECSAPLRSEGGCYVCTECAYSKCG